MIPYTRQSIDEGDIAAVAAVLRSDWLTSGPAIGAFETAIQDLCGASYAVAVSSASTGLHLACLALGVGPGDYVWTSPNSFVASADCALQCGASVDFVDIDPLTYNVSPTALERKLEVASKAGKLPKAIVAVHFGGQPCDLEAIAAPARRHGVAVIEDASHALGASYLGRPIGSCAYSDVTVFSFHASKSIATGEGGMLVTNREDVARFAALNRTHGVTRDARRMENDLDTEPWRYDKLTLGFNYRMTDMQAALGTSQLARLDEFVKRRSYLAGRYDAALASLPVQLPYRDSESSSAWHLYPIQILHGARAAVRRALFEELQKNGIASQVHFIPTHTQPYYRALGFKPGDFPVAESYYAGALSLPLFYDLTERDQDRVIDVVQSVIGRSAVPA